MRKNSVYFYIVYTIIGILLWTLSTITHTIDTFWSGFGAGLVILSVFRFLQFYRYKTNTVYAQKINLQNKDERNRFLADKARSFAYFYGILACALFCILFQIIGYKEASFTLGYVICLFLILYYVGYHWLKRKY